MSQMLNAPPTDSAAFAMQAALPQKNFRKYQILQPKSTSKSIR